MQGRGLLGVAAGDAADLRQPGVDAVPEHAQVPGGRVCRHGGQAGVAGSVRLVDEGAQLAGDLAGADRVRVGLGGVFDVPEDAGGAELVADAVEVVVAGVPVMHDDGAVQVAVDEVPE